MPYQKDNDSHYYATEEESRTALTEFQQSFPLIYQAAAQSFANANRNIRAYYATHDLPPKDQRSNDYELHSPARRLVNTDPAQFDTSLPEDQVFEKAFQQMFQEEYPKQYMTEQLLGDHLHKMEKKHLARTEGNIFLYSPKVLDDAEGLQSSQRKLIAEQTARMEQLRQSGCNEKELSDRAKAIRLIQQINEQTRKLFEQCNYESSRAYLINDQKDKLIQQTSQQTYDKFKTLVQSEYETLGYETAQNCAVMDAIGTELKKDTFSFSNVEKNLKYYPQALYQQALKEYDLQRAADVQASPDISAETKQLSGLLSDDRFKNALDAAKIGMNAKHRFGLHSDSPEMQQLKTSTANLKSLMEDMNGKILDDPSYAERVQTALDQALEHANHYLAEKDREGKALSDRTQMGQTRYNAVKSLAENLQRIKDNQRWRETTQFHQQNINETFDRTQRNMLQQQFECRQNLFALTEKPTWNDADRQAVQQGIATLVSCQKLSWEETMNHDLNGPMWTYQKQHGDLIQKLATAIKDDAPIREAAQSMDQRKLAHFLIHANDIKLNLRHAKNWLSTQTAKTQKNQEPTHQVQHKEPQMGR